MMLRTHRLSILLHTIDPTQEKLPYTLLQVSTHRGQVCLIQEFLEQHWFCCQNLIFQGGLNRVTSRSAPDLGTRLDMDVMILLFGGYESYSAVACDSSIQQSSLQILFKDSREALATSHAAYRSTDWDCRITFAGSKTPGTSTRRFPI